jgi:hypothetical protein
MCNVNNSDCNQPMTSDVEVWNENKIERIIPIKRFNIKDIKYLLVWKTIEINKNVSEA